MDMDTNHLCSHLHLSNSSYSPSRFPYCPCRIHPIIICAWLWRMSRYDWQSKRKWDESYYKLDLEQCKLSEAEKQLVTHYFKQNIKCFAMKLDDLRHYKDYPYVIRTRTAKPIAQRYYQTLPVMQREIEKQLHELLKLTLINRWVMPRYNIDMIWSHASGE